MTFRQIQDDVMGRLNLATDEARARIKRCVNQRYREIQSGVGLGDTRRGSVNFVTASGDPSVTATGIAKIFAIYDPTVQDRVLTEMSLHDLRALDTPQDNTDVPEAYAITAHVADSVAVEFYPKPLAVYTFPADCLLAGTEMTADNDVPAFPTDFHDALVWGAYADELMRMDKTRPQADRAEQKFAQRVADLRYFLAKRAYLDGRQSARTPSLSGRVWPYSNLA